MLCSSQFIIEKYGTYPNGNKMSFMGIIICGLNGTGKSTLGKALARLHYSPYAG